MKVVRRVDEEGSSFKDNFKTTESEIASTASRICKARDHDAADARAMLNEFAHYHDHAETRALVEQMQRQSRARYKQAMAVFAGLPPMTFEAALRIKRSRNDPSANGWHLMNDGLYCKDMVIDGSIAFPK
jgi:hypothetical protein